MAGRSRGGSGAGWIGGGVDSERADRPGKADMNNMPCKGPCGTGVVHISIPIQKYVHTTYLPTRIFYLGATWAELGRPSGGLEIETSSSAVLRCSGTR